VAGTNDFARTNPNSTKEKGTGAVLLAQKATVLEGFSSGCVLTEGFVTAAILQQYDVGEWTFDTVFGNPVQVPEFRFF
jgi:hypothetical protein